MPPSAKEIAELKRNTPKVLREPSKRPLASGPKVALMRWAAAEGFRPTEIMTVPYADGSVRGFSLIGHVSAIALWIQSATEVEQERSSAIAAKSGAKTREQRPMDERLSFLSRLQNVGDFKPSLADHAPRVKAQAQALAAELRKHQAKGEVLERKLQQMHQAYEASKANMIIPLAALGYLDEPRRDPVLAEKRSLLHVLMGQGVSLLQAIAMIGELQSGSVAVDLDHRRRDEIYDAHRKGLQRMHAKLRKLQDRLTPEPTDLSIGKKSRLRQKGPHAAAQGSRRKRARTVDRP